MAICVLWKYDYKVMKAGLALVVMAIFVGNYQRVYSPMLYDNGYQNNTYVQIGEYLMQEGYENAYTGFEFANIITVANDGKIQVSAISSFSNMEISRWLTSKRWYVPNVPRESKTAYLVTEAKLEEFAPFLEAHKEELEYKTKIGWFYIYGSDYNYTKLVD